MKNKLILGEPMGFELINQIRPVITIAINKNLDLMVDKSIFNPICESIWVLTDDVVSEMVWATIHNRQYLNE